MVRRKESGKAESLERTAEGERSRYFAVSAKTYTRADGSHKERKPRRGAAAHTSLEMKSRMGGSFGGKKRGADMTFQTLGGFVQYGGGHKKSSLEKAWWKGNRERMAQNVSDPGAPFLSNVTDARRRGKWWKKRGKGKGAACPIGAGGKKGTGERKFWTGVAGLVQYRL